MKSPRGAIGCSSDASSGKGGTFDRQRLCAPLRGHRKDLLEGSIRKVCNAFAHFAGRVERHAPVGVEVGGRQAARAIANDKKNLERVSVSNYADGVGAAHQPKQRSDFPARGLERDHARHVTQ